jgi:hypothetical protein
LPPAPPPPAARARWWVVAAAAITAIGTAIAATGGHLDLAFRLTW